MTKHESTRSRPTAASLNEHTVVERAIALSEASATDPHVFVQRPTASRERAERILATSDMTRPIRALLKPFIGLFGLDVFGPALLVLPLLLIVLAFGGGRAAAGDVGGRLAVAYAGGFVMVWWPVAVNDLLMRRRSRLHPCTIVTTVEIVMAQYDHVPLSGQRLQDADNFQRIKTYDSQERALGLGYHFQFGRRTLRVIVNDPAQQQRLDAVLAEARALRDNPVSQAAALSQYGMLPDDNARVPLAVRLKCSTSDFWLIAFTAYTLVGIVGAFVLMAFTGR